MFYLHWSHSKIYSYYTLSNIESVQCAGAGVLMLLRKHDVMRIRCPISLNNVYSRVRRDWDSDS